MQFSRELCYWRAPSSCDGQHCFFNLFWYSLERSWSIILRNLHQWFRWTSIHFTWYSSIYDGTPRCVDRCIRITSRIAPHSCLRWTWHSHCPSVKCSWSVPFSKMLSVFRDFLLISNFLDCVWPHYASRLSLELWTNHHINPQYIYYLRVVYNGDDVTSLIPSCYGKIINEGQSTFCPLDDILEQFDKILSPYRNRKRACHAKGTS